MLELGEIHQEQCFEPAESCGTPKSRVSEIRLKLLQLTPVQNFLVVDRSTYIRQYRDTARRTEQIKPKLMHSELKSSESESL